MRLPVGKPVQYTTNHPHFVKEIDANEPSALSFSQYTSDTHPQNSLSLPSSLFPLPCSPLPLFKI